jgi:hypothetical protein
MTVSKQFVTGLESRVADQSLIFSLVEPYKNSVSNPSSETSILDFISALA